MKQIARIVVLVALVLFGDVYVSYSALPMPKTEARWEILYRRAVKQIHPKNRYEIEWMRLNREVKESSARNGEPEQIIALAEQAYDYALKYLGGHPFTRVSKKRLLFQIYPKYGQSEKSRLLYMYGRLYSQLLLKEKSSQFFKKWEERYAKGRKAFSNEERSQVIMAAEDAYHYANKYLGPEHPATLISINQLFMFYYNSGRYLESEPICNQAIKIRKKIFGLDHPETLSSMYELVKLYAALGRKNQAELLGNQLLQQEKKVLGEDHPSTLVALQAMASLYSSQGRKHEVEPLLKELLYKNKKKKERMGGRKDSRIIKQLTKLYLSQGRRSEAEPLLQEWAEAVKNTVREPELAEIYQLQGKYAEAESLLKKILNLPDEFMYPTVDYGRINAKRKLGNLYAKQKRYAEAEHLQKEVIKLQERAYGEDHPDNIEVIRAVAMLNQYQGKYKNAESFFQEAIRLSEKVFPAQHPKAIRPFRGYIFLLFATDQYDSAFSLVQDWESRLLSRSFQELYTSSNHNVRRLYEQTVNFFLNTVPSLAVRRPEEKYQKYAADVILRWKQLYAEEEAFQHQQLALSNVPEVIKLRNNLAEARIKLSQALLKKKREEELASLMDDYSEAETALLAETKRFKSHLEVEKASLDNVLSFLPQDSGLIEYRRFRSVDLKADKTEELHLAALLLLADPKAKQRFVFRDLGPFSETGKLTDELAELRKKISEINKQLQNTEPMDPAAAVLLKQRDALEKEAAEKNTAACRPLILPFDKQIKNLKQLYIAPDGPLSLLSFASLRLPDGRFLAERQQINRLQTGRDLIENGKDFSRGKGLVAIGGAEYGNPPASQTESVPKLAASYQQRAAQMLRNGVAVLKNSGPEVETINTIFTNNISEDAQVFLGENASEYNLKHLKHPPRILHLSTHGFYLAKDAESRLADEAPLLLSGLALAGANNGLQGKLDKHGDDGLLYSLEVLGLNLQGTELVSLSACDTGKGVMDYSEGVYGLVRAFRTAGAKNVLMTLTPVGDKSSREFMETFYDNWLSSEDNISPAQALHKTRLDFIHHKNLAYRDPAVWSPYVMVGR